MEIKTVTVPGSAEHNGLFSIRIKLNWVCPICGERRGEIIDAISYDGSRRLNCNGWHNPCGHVDKYSALRQEAMENGLNNRESK